MPPPAALRTVSAAALLLLSTGLPPAWAAEAAEALPGAQDLLFDIRRDGAPVGTHRVTIRPTAGGLHAEAQSTIAVRLLGIAVYRFDYRSASDWVAGRMVGLDSVTDDDGTVTRVSAKADGDRLRITSTGGNAVAPLGLLPTDHWNPAVIGAQSVLNTITGRVARVTMAAQGRERVPVGGESRPSTRYTYTGDLEATVWYDDSGHWTGLRFAARDGSVIDYVCRRCGADAAVAEGGR